MNFSKTAQYSPTDRDRLLYLKRCLWHNFADENCHSISERSGDLLFRIANAQDLTVHANAPGLYQKAWSQFRKVPSTGFPAFKRRSNSFSYGTNCNYPSDVLNNPDTIGLYEGAVRFLDHNHIHLPIPWKDQNQRVRRCVYGYGSRKRTAPSYNPICVWIV
jgi:hypothetical protein